MRITPVTGRRQTAETQFIDTTQVSVRPSQVPTITPVVQSTKTSKLAEIMGLTSGLASTIGATAEAVGAKEKEKGYIEGLTQQTPGETLGFQFQERLEGYDLARGELEASRNYRQSINELLKNAENLTTEEFQEQLRNLSDKTLENSSEAFQKGFIKQGIDIETQAISQFAQIKSAQERQESFNILNQLSMDTAEQEVTKILNNLFSGGIVSMEDLNKTPEIYTALDTQDYSSVFSVNLNKAWANVKDTGQRLGFNKEETSKLFVQQIGQLAIRYGLPELLEFTEMKDTDYSTIGLEGGAEDTIAYSIKAYPDLNNMVEQYKIQAENQRNSRELALDRAISAQQKEDLRIWTNQVLTDISDIQLLDDPLEASSMALQMKEALRDNPYFYQMEASRVSQINTTLNQLINGDRQFPQIGDEYTYFNLKLRAMDGEATMEEISNAIMENDLTLTQAKELVADVKQAQLHEEQVRNNKDNKRVSLARGQIAEIRNNAINAVIEKDVLGLYNDKQRFDVSFRLLQAEDRYYKLHGEDISFNSYKSEVLEPFMIAEGLKVEDISLRSEIEPPVVLSTQTQRDISPRPPLDLGTKEITRESLGMSGTTKEAGDTTLETPISVPVIPTRAELEAYMRDTAGFNTTEAIDYFRSSIDQKLWALPNVSDYLKEIGYQDIQDFAIQEGIDLDNPEAIRTALQKKQFSDLGLSIQQIDQDLLDEGHTSEDIKAYNYLYAYTTAEMFLRQGYENPYVATQEATLYLRALGYDDDTIRSVVADAFSMLSPDAILWQNTVPPKPTTTD